MTLVRKALVPGRIVLDLDVSSKKRLLEHIALVIENTASIARARVFEALFAREKLGSTGLGLGVAIPHGRLKALKEVTAVFVRSRDGIAFDAPDEQPVRLFLAILVPENANEQHLLLLSELAQMFSDDELRAALLNAADAESVTAILDQWTPYANAQRPAVV
jgi:PTS system nitrogen regulatory IIA component